MNYYIRDWLNVIVIIIFAPFIFGILYLVLGSSVSDPERGMWYLYVLIVIFFWILFNTMIGYIVSSKSRTISYPYNFNLLRRKIDLKGLTCYDIIGFDEYGTSDNGLGFRSYKIILNGSFGIASLIFSREETARAVYAALKDSAPGFGVREGECLIK